jgi:hypothetical protein
VDFAPCSVCPVLTRVIGAAASSGSASGTTPSATSSASFGFSAPAA